MSLDIDFDKFDDLVSFAYNTFVQSYLIAGIFFSRAT